MKTYLIPSKIKVLIAGFGGQGVMFLGRVLAQAAILEGKNVTYLPSYGAEVRGGTANCLVKLSKGKIASPVFEKANFAIIMNEPSWQKFKRRIEDEGFVLLNSSLIKDKVDRKDVNIEMVPLNDLALKVGSLQVANFIGLGAFLRETGIVKLNSVKKVLVDIFKEKPQFVNLNWEALRTGFNYNGKE